MSLNRTRTLQELRDICPPTTERRHHRLVSTACTRHRDLSMHCRPARWPAPRQRVLTFDPHPAHGGRTRRDDAADSHHQLYQPGSSSNALPIDGVFVAAVNERNHAHHYRDFHPTYYPRRMDMPSASSGYYNPLGGISRGHPERVSEEGTAWLRGAKRFAVRVDRRSSPSATTFAAPAAVNLRARSTSPSFHAISCAARCARQGKRSRLGFPTAMSRCPIPTKLCPPTGVYAVRVAGGAGFTTVTP